MSGKQHKPIRLGIVDGLSLRGRELRAALEESDLPLEDIRLYDRDEVAGTLTEQGGEPVLVQRLSEEEMGELDVLVYCGQGDLVANSLRYLLAGQTLVLDLTGTMSLKISRVVVSGVNDDVADSGRLFRAAHPAAAMIAAILAPLSRSLAVARAEAVVLEPVAERGERGIDQLYEQARDLLNFRKVATDVLGGRLAFNVLPAWGAAGRAAEERIGAELRFLLGDEAPSVSLMLLRVPVFLGIGLGLTLEMVDEEDSAAVPGLLAAAPTLELSEEPAAPGDLPERGSSSPILVTLYPGPDPGRVRLWAATDYIGRGSVRHAVELIARRLGGGARA